VDFSLIYGLDNVQGLLTVADGPAEDLKPSIDEPVKEGCVLIPALLITDPARGIPARPVNQPHREISRRRNVPVTADDHRPSSIASVGSATTNSPRRGLMPPS
jgi:hypothetical protein